MSYPHKLAEHPAPHQPPEDVLAWLRGKTPAELNAIEATDPESKIPYPLFPDVMRYRNAKGEICEVPVMLKIPRENDLARATREAVQHVAGMHKGKNVETPDQARELVGATRFENFDTAALVALCAREVQPPHQQAYLLRTLVGTFDPSTIQDVFERLDMLRRTWDVRVGEITEEQLWGFVLEVARVRNLSPLAVLVPALQGGFILRVVCELAAYRMSKSSSGSSEPSTPRSSDPMTSE